MKSFLPSIIIGILLIGGVGAFVFMQNNDMPAAPAQPETSALPTETGAQTTGSTGTTATTPTAPQGQPVPATPSAPATASGITSAEVATHASRTSCWSIINGNVYDLTSWIPKHPGGESAILSLCGTDGSRKFNGQHGGDSGKLRILSGFKIGVAAN